MPELPEVEITCRGISPYATGKIVESVTVRDSRLRVPITADFATRITQQYIVSISRRAKYMIIQLSTGNILLHLGMSGHLRILAEGSPAQKHDHVDINLNSGYLIRYHDPRRFGLIQWFDQHPAQHPLLQHLGPEPLSESFTGEYLLKSAAKRAIAVKQFIMENKTVVGIGNIYASESLFLAGISPLRATNQISGDRYLNLAAAIKCVLTQAIEKGGTTLKDFYNSDGKPGYFANSLQVYGREGKACINCNSKIKSIIIGQRNSYYCPGCQT